ncbi:MAG: metallophosphoesterase [Peptoniphilus sp.]|nr:metallophosphoesterase [Peptoniphilus sp.]MDD7363571.1 metallophosphoesterase [Bacillota bacterium]MDY6044685.1 metallophosphoesterase [Peptoniphilus sp.]
MKILQLTDVHFASYPFEGKDKKTEALIRKLIDSNRPEMIAVTGDLVWGVERESLGIVEGVLDFLDSFGIPVAIIWGNHDSEKDFGRRELFHLIDRMANHVKKENRVLIGEREIYTVDIDEENRLILLDSGDYDELGVGHYAFIYPEQIEAVRERAPKDGRACHLFMHIPVAEYDLAKKEGLATGNQDEEVCSPVLNTGLYGHLKYGSNVQNIFCGHDHDNDFSANYHGIGLHYGRVTGYNSYGSLARGGRIIDIDGLNVESYIVE